MNDKLKIFFPGDPKKINDRFDSDLAGYVKENRWQIQDKSHWIYKRGWTADSR